MAGVSRQQYSSEIRLIRVMCSGRIDLEHILRAFSNGHDGVLIGGCRLNECNYVTHGNYDALSNTYLFGKIMAHIGLKPERLGIEFMSGSDGNILGSVINEFTEKVKALGPIGKAEGLDKKDLKRKLQAVGKIIPFLKLVEREKLRVPVKSEEAYREFYTGDELNRIFDDLIVDKMTISQILLLLGEKPLSTGEISEILSLNPSEVSKYMVSSSKHGLVSYDVEHKRYALT
ncbi:MAG: hydrogenase iron-sulfur subunit [Deltaproteobacteria bacterium]|nr:hydrogenase iron-sulfur subunit [Deltaproteobacteria bacterium]